jgi:hypothetical protein
MQSRLFSRVTRAVVAALMLVAFATQLAAAAARPEPGARRSRTGFNLFAEVFTLFLVNRVACGVNNLGEICTDPGNSPIGGGGFWPRGTPDQYIFNSGLQLAGIVDPAAGFAWAGDTTGAYFMDARGTQQQGEGITAVYNSLDPADAQAWPVGAVVRDTAVYDAVLIGRNTISQQDLWNRSWDGNPNLLSGRTHPMGVLVETRGLAWNFPSGNEDILYFVFNFYNVTARNSAVYANLDPAIRDEIAALGQRYADQVQATLGVTLPADGYAIKETYAAFTMDPDVGDASHNYSTAILPFSLAIAYKADWYEPTWVFPPDIFGAPFAAAPGFVGVKYLKSPADPATGEEFGLTMFSNTRNAATAFPDPVGVNQLWRYLSGKVGAGDNPCTGNAPQAVVVERRWCFQDTQDVDTRFYQSSGPFTLEPGQVFTIVVAYVHAAAIPTFQGQQLFTIGTTMAAPGNPASGADIAGDPASTLRPIDRVAGWLSEFDEDQDGEISQYEVTTVPRSILQKSLVAQEVYDKKFLLPSAPEAPSFYLVPGNNQVSVVWQPSVTEQTGDPYFVIANDPTSALFDPNFRQIDVEGYRIYRGRTAGDLNLIAQFDYSGTYFRDFTGAIDYGQCAPELGIYTACPETFDFPISNTGDFHDVDIASPLVQVPAGGRVELADGSVFVVTRDDAVVGAGFPELANTGVPFMFIDNGVVNSLTYFYAVTAFDVNSVNSGPSSLESARIARPVTPKALSPNVTEAELSFGLFGDDDVQLDPNALVTIDPATGVFSGKMAPTNSLAAAFAPLVPQLLPALDLEARIDSLVAHSYTDYSCAGNGLGSCYTTHLTFTKDGVETRDSLNVNWPVWSSFGEPTLIESGLGSVKIPIDPASAARFGIPDTAAAFTAQLSAKFRQYIDFSSFEGQAARRSTGTAFMASGASISAGGSRWFAGNNETEPHPGYGIRVGTLPGVDSVWAPINHTDVDPGTAGAQIYAGSSVMQCFGYALAGLSRHADVRLTWGANGTIASVRDVTHNVDVEFKPNPQASYGFIGDFNGNGFLDYRDYHFLETMSQLAEDFGFCGHTDPGPGARSSLVAQPVVLPVSFSGAATPTGTNGTGFGLYINGERYLFAMPGGALPAEGTVWTLRTYAGIVRASSGAATFTPSGYSFVARERSPSIPGLRVVFSIPTSTSLTPETAESVARVHTVPDPYYVTNAMELTTNRKVLKFVNLPPQAIIRIYSVSGVLVRVIEHNDQGLGGEAEWDLRNRNNQFVASGVYFYHVETAAGNKKVGRFTVVNYAQ